MKSTARENYLKAILELQEHHHREVIGLSLITRELGLSPGTVTGMIKQLAGSGLVEYKAYTGCRLTAEGREIAVKVLRNHRIIELFLVEVIGFDWADVHEEAELIEHAISPKVLSAIDKLLGYPEFDPHGDPIPSADGKIARPDYTQLTACKTGDDCEIARVLDESREFLNFVGDMNLYPGTKIRVGDIHQEAGIMKLKAKGAQPIVMALSAAEKMLIRQAEQ